LAYLDHQERSVRIWDAQTRQSQSVLDKLSELRRQFPSAPDRPNGWNPASQIAVVSPQGDWLAFQVGREFRVWRDGKDRWPEFPRNYDGRFVGALASSPDGNTLAVAVRRGELDLVEVKTGEVTTTWSLAHEVPFAMEFSADGTCLAVGLAGHVAVHDVATGELLADFEQPGLPFVKVAISADGRFIAASSLGDRVWMWDVNGGVELPLLDIGGSIGDLEFAPSGDRLAVLSRGGRLTVWEVAGEKSETRISK
jgi:WD40 repeat protein